MNAQPKLYSPEQANRLIPELLKLIVHLRQTRDKIILQRDKYDVEEITSHGFTGEAAERAKSTMDEVAQSIRVLEDEFEEGLKIFDQVGCSLKSLEPGLVDFYTEMDGQLVFLCWKEGEEEIRHWHRLEDGFQGRQELP